MSLRLCPLRLDDEAEAHDAHAEMADDGFAFLLFRERSDSWTGYLNALDANRRGSHVPDGMVPATFLAAEAGERLVGRCRSVMSSTSGWPGSGVTSAAWCVRPIAARDTRSRSCVSR